MANKVIRTHKTALNLIHAFPNRFTVPTKFSFCASLFPFPKLFYRLSQKATVRRPLERLARFNKSKFYFGKRDVTM